MLSDKVAEKMYNSFCESEEAQLNNNIDYKDAEKLVELAYEEIKNALPEDKRKLVSQLSAYINHRENMFSREAYKKGFKDGAKLISELIK